MEITELKTQEDFDNKVKDWTKLTFNGLNVFDEYNKICELLLKIINQDDEMIEFTGHDNIDGQEVYLGYYPDAEKRFGNIPKNSLYFISGWDLFTDEGGKCCVIELFLTPEGFKFHGISDAMNNLFYDINSMYSMMQKYSKRTRIDIRLD